MPSRRWSIGVLLVLMCAVLAGPANSLAKTGPSHNHRHHWSGHHQRCSYGEAVGPAKCEVFVSPQGHDSWQGTSSRPFATVERAQNAVRQMLAWQPPAITVTLAEGTYRLGQALTLSSQDSGQPGRSVVWRAAPGTAPTLSGGRTITGWHLSDPSKGIYRARARGVDTRQLYVDGSRATRAQVGLDGADFTKTENGFIATGAAAELLTQLTNPTEAELWMKTTWRDFYCGIAGMQTLSAAGEAPRIEVNLDQPCFRNANISYGSLKVEVPSTLENSLSLLHEPGEWYLDKSSGWIYYKPLPGQNMLGNRTTVVAPSLETLVEGHGSMTSPVHDISFEGLTFADATWLAPDTPAGYAADQTGFRFPANPNAPETWGHVEELERTPGNVRFEYGQRITFAKDHFTRLGGAGLDLDTGSQENAIRESTFEDISGAAIELGGLDPEDSHPTDPRQVTRDNDISDNVVENVGNEYFDAPGIFVGYTTRTTIEHNQLSHLPYTGISVGYGYGLTDPGGTERWQVWMPSGPPNGGWKLYQTPTPSQENRVIANRISDYMQVLTDGGGIYTMGWQGSSLATGMKIEENVVSGASGPYFGYYTDAGSRFITLRRNVGLAPSGASFPWNSTGGCAPWGDLRYEENYWSAPTGPILFPGPFCGTTGPGEEPTNIEPVGNVAISSLAEAPQEVVEGAGPR